MFTNDPAGVLWDATALSNAFICEYMPAAPEGYVKVYLYGLLYAHHPPAGESCTADTLARELGMEKEAVASAFRYWERCRLVARTRDDPPAYRYLSVQQAMIGKQGAPADEDYMAFAQALYALFGDRRKLHGNETTLAYEWVEQLGLPREVVLMMVQYMISTRGVQFSFKEAQTVAADLCQQHVSTIEAAEQRFSRSEAAWKGAQRVLRRMGKYRHPSLDETDLFVKWTTDWGFQPKFIEASCAEMTAGDPSFKYLDGVLGGIRERAGHEKTDAEQLSAQLKQEKEEAALAREMYRAFGQKASTLDEGRRNVYRAMRELAPHEVIVLAAQCASKKREPSLDDVERLLLSWRDKGLTDVSAVRAHLSDLDDQNRFLAELYALSGKEPRPTPGDRKLLSVWRGTWGFGDEMLREAAKLAQSADKPMPYLHKLLERWHAQGITTPEQAAREKPPAPERKGKTVREQRYDQRTDDLSKYEELSEEEWAEVQKYVTK